jgi:hypothetical protein
MLGKWNFPRKMFQKLVFPRNSAEFSAESDFPWKKMYEKSAPRLCSRWGYLVFLGGGHGRLEVDEDVVLGQRAAGFVPGVDVMKQFRPELCSGQGLAKDIWSTNEARSCWSSRLKGSGHKKNNWKKWRAVEKEGGEARGVADTHPLTAVLQPMVEGGRRFKLIVPEAQSLLRAYVVANFDPRGKLSPRGEFCPLGWSYPLGVKLSVRPSVLLNSRECSPMGWTKGWTFPLGVKFTPGGQGWSQEWPSACQTSEAGS